MFCVIKLSTKSINYKEMADWQVISPRQQMKEFPEMSAYFLKIRRCTDMNFFEGGLSFSTLR